MMVIEENQYRILDASEITKAFWGNKFVDIPQKIV